jgi:hypothetical protein
MRQVRITNGQGHSRACIPTALSVILNKPYVEVNAWLKYRGYRRGDNRGTSTSLMSMSSIGLEKESNAGVGKSVNQFLNLNPQGNFLVIVKGHGLAAKNGSTL